MVKHQVKVVVRTRPTNNFASKNINIDGISSVNILKFLIFNNRQSQCKFLRVRVAVSSTINKKHGNSSSIKFCITLPKKKSTTTVLEILLGNVWMVTMAQLWPMAKLVQERRSQSLDLHKITSTEE